MKWLAVLAVAGIALVACGSASNGPSSNSGQLAALNHHVNVTFWEAMATAGQRTTMDAITQKFNSSQSNVTVTLQVYPDYNTLRAKTLASLAAGSPPDLAQCAESWASQYNQSHALANLTPYINAADGLSQSDQSDFWPIMLKDGLLNGKQYMMPFNKSVNVLYYNPNLFAAAGISAPPKTWTEFANDAKMLTGNGHWGTDFSDNLGYESVWETMLPDSGGALLNATQTKTAFNSAAGRGAIQFWADLVKAGYAHRTQGYSDQADFGSGHAAMIISTIAGYTIVKQAIGSKFSFKLASVPGGPDGTFVDMFGTNACVFNKSAPDVQQGAFQYIKYFTSKEGTTTWSEGTGYMPVRQSAYADMQSSFYNIDPNLAVPVAELPSAIVQPNLPVWQEATQDIMIQLLNVVDGKATAEASIASAAQTVDGLLSSNY